MNQPLRNVSYAAGLAVSAGALLLAARLGSASGENNLTVHEWGTFTSVAAEDGSAEDWEVLGGKDDLPKFVNDKGYRGFKFRLIGTVRMETPVLYFYSPTALSASVRVSFPKGLLTEWYPRAKEEVERRAKDGSTRLLPPNLNGLDTSLLSLTGSLAWNDIKVEPGSAPDFRREPSASRYYAARGTDAAPLTVDGQHEKFLFYRGVGRIPVPLSARISPDGRVTVSNCGDYVPMAILFENRGGRLGYRVVEGISGQVTIDPPTLGGPLEPLLSELQSALVEQGLFEKEAQAMIATWRDSWFEEGSRIVYLVPSSTVNTVLPLQINPAPSRIARVFVGRIELITKETERSVEAAIDAKDACVVDRYGRFLGPVLKRLVKDNPASATAIDDFWANYGKQTSYCTPGVDE